MMCTEHKVMFASRHPLTLIQNCLQCAEPWDFVRSYMRLCLQVLKPQFRVKQCLKTLDSHCRWFYGLVYVENVLREEEGKSGTGRGACKRKESWNKEFEESEELKYYRVQEPSDSPGRAPEEEDFISNWSKCAEACMIKRPTDDCITLHWESFWDSDGSRQRIIKSCRLRVKSSEFDIIFQHSRQTLLLWSLMLSVFLFFFNLFSPNSTTMVNSDLLWEVTVYSKQGYPAVRKDHQ